MNAVDLVVRSSAILVAGLIAHRLLARRSAALRHFVLAAAILLSVVVVPLSLVLPSWDVRLPATPRRAATVSSTVTARATPTPVNAPPISDGVDFAGIAVMCWATGFAFTALLLLGEGWRL